MTRGAHRRRIDEAGFTLVELLVATVILGIISYTLTESVILGLRTTDSTAASSSRFVATQTLASYFTGDAQSADTVSRSDPTDPSDPSDPPCATEPVFLHLTWFDGERRAVSYALDPAAGPEQDLVRWSCTGGAPPDRKILGHFSRSPDPGAPPVVATCDGNPCPAAAGEPPDTITIDVQSVPALTLTVRRRSG